MSPIGCEASGYIACPILTPDRAFRLAREPRMLAAVSGLDFRLYGLANNLRTVSRQLRCPPHARQCLLNVDSSRRVSAIAVVPRGGLALGRDPAPPRGAPATT